MTAPHKMRAKPAARSDNARASSKSKASAPKATGAKDTASAEPGSSRNPRASRQTTVRTEEEEAEELERQGFTFVDEDDGTAQDNSSRGDGSGSEESSSSDDEGAAAEEPIGSEDELGVWLTIADVDVLMLAYRIYDVTMELTDLRLLRGPPDH